MIVLDEHSWAEDVIMSRDLGKKPFEALSRVARYYIDKGHSKKETRDMLESFLLKCDPTVSLPKWSKTLDYAVSKATKYKAVVIDGIGITRSELETIGNLSGVQLKRLAFTLLCLAKYWDIVNPNADHWVNNKDSEIMRLANINTSIERQSMLYHELRKNGLIQFSKKVDNTNVRVCFISNDDDVAETITDYRNLGYQYMLLSGSNEYVRCVNCGLVVRKNSVIPAEFPQRNGSQRYCRACALEVRLQRKVDSVTKFATHKMLKNDN